MIAATGGTSPVNVTNNGVDDFEPSVSPDGTKIAYRSYDATGGDWEIYKIPVTGGPRDNVTEDDVDNFHPSWGVQTAP
jgi:TolB protein